VKIREVIKLIEADGWVLVRTKGSHRQYHHPEKPGTVTVPGKPSDDLSAGLLNSILRQAGLRE
jgi:predicted RNA binding protein YcfA (HicA-like mRNA interferase family)